MPVQAATYIGPNPYLDRGIPGFPFGPDQAGPETGPTRSPDPEPDPEVSSALPRQAVVTRSQAAGLAREVVQSLLDRPAWLVSRIHDLERASLLGTNYV